MPTPSTFTKRASGFDITAAPIDIQQFLFDMAMKRRVRPVLHLPNQSMLDWIVVHVVDMPLQVQVVAYLVFPKTPLPDAFFAFRYLAIASLRRRG